MEPWDLILAMGVLAMGVLAMGVLAMGVLAIYSSQPWGRTILSICFLFYIYPKTHINHAYSVHFGIEIG
jgi:hypothetical protein